MTIFLTIVLLILFVIALLLKLGFLTIERREVHIDEIPGVRRKGTEIHISFNRNPKK